MNKQNGAVQLFPVLVADTGAVEVGCFIKGKDNGTWSEHWKTNTTVYPQPNPNVTVNEVHYGHDDQDYALVFAAVWKTAPGPAELDSLLRLLKS